MKNSALKVCLFVSLLAVSAGFNLSYAKIGGSSSGKKNSLKASSENVDKSKDSTKAEGSQAAVKITDLPIAFEENKGQAGSGVKFLSRSRNYNLFLNADGSVLQFRDTECEAKRKLDKDSRGKTMISASKPCKIYRLGMKMLGINGEAAIQGTDELIAKSNYIIGNDSSKWQTGITNFQGVFYRGVYDGIDLVFRGAEQKLEYDFHVAPGADPNLIRLEFDGTKKIKIDRDGDLVFKFKGMEIRHQQPFAYQIIDGQKKQISARFISLGKNKIGFIVGDYDKTKELVIDPIIYATYLGGSRQDYTEDITVDSAGYIYLASDAQSENFLDPNGTIIPGVANDKDIFVTKLSPDGTQIIFNTVVGGNNSDIPWAIDIDGFQNIYVGGQTSSTNFPMVNARQTSHSIADSSDVEGYVFKLNASGNSLAYSTYHGATSNANGYHTDWVESVNVDSSGNLYAVGLSGGTNFPLLNAYSTSIRGNFSAYLSKLSPSGQLLYSTFFTGIESFCWTAAYDVDVDDNGFAYISGEVAGAGHVPTTPGAYKTSGTGFIAKFDTEKTGSGSLVYATHSPSIGEAIGIDSYGNAAVVDSGSRFRIGNGVKINSAGTAAVFTFTTRGSAGDLAINAAGNIYYTEDIDDPTNPSRTDVLVKGLSPTGALLGTEVLHATASDRATGIAIGLDNLIYVVGYTGSLDFPTTSGALQPNSRYAIPGGSSLQGFFAKVRLDPPEPLEPLIFIPGVAGSDLYEADADGNPKPVSIDTPVPRIWLSGAVTDIFGFSLLNKLDLTPPASSHPNIVAVDVLRDELLGAYKVYGPLFRKLEEVGYVEYDIQKNPKRRNVQCDPSWTDVNGKKPTLFVFAYDWRLSNAEAAQKLSAYIDCVRSFYSDKKVNILTHSLGALVARRYILDHQNEQKVKRLVTLVAPFLGAPKAIDALFTGRFVGKAGYYAHKDAIKKVVSYAPGAHELLPSEWYYDLESGADKTPFAYKSPYLQLTTDYNYAQAKNYLNNYFPSKPYDNNQSFHNYSNNAKLQDNWSSDSSGIKYYHIYGVERGESTIGKVIHAPYIVFPQSDEQRDYGVELEYTKGDGTVPLLSAKRARENLNPILLAPNTKMKQCNAPFTIFNSGYDHNGVLTNPVIWEELLAMLEDRNINQPECVTNFSNSPLTEEGGGEGNTAENGGGGESNETSGGQQITNDASLNYLQVYKVNRLQITDESGNTNTQLNPDADKAVPDIDYEYGSSAVDSLVEPHEVSFAAGKKVDIKFVAPANRVKIVNSVGTDRNNPAQSVKYMDLQLPAGATAWLKFTETGVENLRLDANNDGTFETEIQPTFTLTGAAATDKTPPTVSISYTVNNNVATVTASAADNETGINQIRYIINSENIDRLYNSPFTIDLTQTQLIYVCAEDNAGNRSLLAKWLDLAVPNTSVNQTPPANSAGWNTSDITLELKAVDDIGGAGVESLTYGGSGAQPFSQQTLAQPDAPLTYPKPNTATDFLAKTFNFYTEGVTTLTFFAKDKAGNVEATKTHFVKIDKSDPISQHTLVDNGQQTTFTLNAADAVSGVSEIVYSIDGAAAQTYTAPFSVSNTGGHYVTFYARDLAGNEEAPHTIYINAAQVSKSVLVSEFRTRGSLGADDEFIELYNSGDTNVDISGWVVSIKQGSVSTPTTLATINSGAVIPARGHYLLRKAGASNYSLSAYAEADQTYSGAMGDNVGIALFSTASIIIDAVGFSSVTDTTYREGTALAPAAGISTSGQYSFVRNYNSRGFPVDSNSNRADFIFVATDGATYNNLKAVLGSPGPENLSSPVYRSGAILVNQVDDKVTLAESPNRVYDYTATSQQYPVGILSLRRKLTNNTGSTVTGLRLRITGLTTRNSAVIFPQQAIIRLINSADISVTSGNGQTTIPLKGLTIDAIPTTVDGGFNTSLTLNLGGNGLANGDSLNIDLKSGIVTNGQYRLEFTVEAVISTP
jgi:pimeloyl-ACP methyl ester carboxylesterase